MSLPQECENGLPRRDFVGIAALLASSFVSGAAVHAEGSETPKPRPGSWAARPKGSTFEAAEVTEGFTATESGLTYKDVSVGKGKLIEKGMKVKFNFAGYVLETGKGFDNSWEKGRVAGFKVGAKEPIAGLDEGLEGMKIGGRRILVIPPELAYRNKRVYGGLIPASSTVVIYVQPVEEASFIFPLENVNAWLIGALPDEPKPKKKEIECFNPKGCF